MTLDDLGTLLDFHYWARDRVLDAADALTPEQFTKDLGSSFKSVRDTLAHIYGAEWAWHQRWIGESPTGMPSFDRFPDVPSLRSAWGTLETQVRGYLESVGEPGVSQVFRYKSFAGYEGASPFWQMLQHLVNHGSYHRGQVTTMLRQLGAAPARSLDLIAFYREQQSRQ